MRVQQLGATSLVFRTHSSSRYSVAALIGSLEIDSRLLDLDIDVPTKFLLKSIKTRIERGPVIIAFSVMSTQARCVYEEIQKIREQYTDELIIVGGGAHASARPRELLANGFDFVVVGEGEKVFPDFVAALMNGNDPLKIPGVVGQSTTEIPTPRELPMIELSHYPPFALQKNIVGPVEVTRGCPFRCKFCCTPFLTGGIVRHRTIDSIVAWVKNAVQKRGFKRTWFLSPNALSYGGRGRQAEPNKLEQLLKSVSSIDGLEEVYCGSFPSEVRPEFVTRPILEMLRSYVANETLQIGLQSSSDRILALSNRKHTVEQGLNAVRTALDTGFTPHVDMIFGLPGETTDELHKSIELCYDLVEMGAKTHGHVFMPLPGSDFERAPPGRLDPESRKLLGELARRKELTGSWSTQERLSEELWSQNKRTADFE